MLCEKGDFVSRLLGGGDVHQVGDDNLAPFILHHVGTVLCTLIFRRVDLQDFAIDEVRCSHQLGNHRGHIGRERRVTWSVLSASSWQTGSKSQDEKQVSLVHRDAALLSREGIKGNTIRAAREAT